MVRFLPAAAALLALSACAVPMQEPVAPPPAMPAMATAEVPPAAEQAAPEAQAAAPAQSMPQAPGAKAAPPRRPAAPSIPAPPAPPVPADLDSKPIEEVVVKPADVTGYWRLVTSRNIDLDVGIFSGIHIRYGGEIRDRNICWLQQRRKSLEALCSSGYALKSAEGSVGDDGITMRWWVGAANIIFDGKFIEAEKIAGGFSGGVVGLSVTGDIPATLVRLNPPDAPPADAPERPTAALMRMVWEDQRRGEKTPGRYDPASAKRIEQGFPREMWSQPIEQMVYLGQILIHWRKEQRETLQDVYQIRTSSGRKMCRLATNDQGQVLDFNCLTLPG